MMVLGFYIDLTLLTTAAERLHTSAAPTKMANICRSHRHHHGMHTFARDVFLYRTQLNFSSPCSLVMPYKRSERLQTSNGSRRAEWKSGRIVRRKVCASQPDSTVILFTESVCRVLFTRRDQTAGRNNRCNEHACKAALKFLYSSTMAKRIYSSSQSTLSVAFGSEKMLNP